jgi:hypothetical protein
MELLLSDRGQSRRGRDSEMRLSADTLVQPIRKTHCSGRHRYSKSFDELTMVSAASKAGEYECSSV